MTDIEPTAAASGPAPNRQRRVYLEPYMVANENLDASILNTAYVEAARPYSQLELAKTRKFACMQLGLATNVYAYHPECGHVYYVRMHGKKYKDILESKNTASGNCSVCWKQRQTPRKLVRNLEWLLDEYMKVFTYQHRTAEEADGVPRLTGYQCWIESVYNTWLNREEFERRAPARGGGRGRGGGQWSGQQREDRRQVY